MKRFQQRLVHILLSALLLFLLLLTLVPLLWMLSLSMKNNADIISGRFSLLPDAIRFSNYSYAWNTCEFFVYFQNSLYVSFASIVFIVLLSLANAYALSRYSFKQKEAFMLILVMTQMIPTVLIMPTIFTIIKNMGLMNTHAALILLNVVSGIPFNTLLMKGFISAIPYSLEEAAQIDGANKLMAFVRAALPIAVPGVVAVAAFAFISCWNEFINAYSIISSNKLFLISVGLKFMIGEFSTKYDALAASGIIALLPPILLFAYLQKYLVGGLSSGSVKG